MKISILFPDQKLEFKKLSETTVHDIGMDSIIKQLTKKEDERVYIRNVMSMFTDDVETAAYRSDVFDDIYRNKDMRKKIMELLDRVNFLKDYGSYKHDNDHEPSTWDLLHRLDEIRDYIECIEKIYDCLENSDIHSKGLNSLKDYVSSLYHDNGFDGLKEDISSLRATTDNLKSVTVGINLNERFEACGIGVISINNKPFTGSGVLSHFIEKVSGKDNIQNGTDWNGDYKYNEFTAQSPYIKAVPMAAAFSPMQLMTIRNISEAEDQSRSITNYMDNITDRLLSKTVKHLRNVLNKYATLTITDITDLMPEFSYYIHWVEFIEKFTEKGFEFCKSGPEKNGISMKAEGIYNLKLLEKSDIKDSDIVKNDLDFSDEHCLYILTGANRGGKTTITQAIGQAFFLAQGGVYVPGSRFTYTPCDGIFTHFPADEDKTLDLGRLGEECKRFKEIYEKATGHSLILLNETFSTTSFEEGYYIARDCEKAILAKGIRCIYNTHMHKLAFEADELNAASGDKKAVSLVVRTEEGGERSYKVEIAPPEGMSYANDIARKYGVTYEMLTDL